MMRETIESKLREALSPEHIEVIDESHGHNVRDGAESHFKVILISAAFAGQRAVRRHQTVYGLLREELQGSVHALALHLYTPEEWRQRAAAPQSPPCLGGSKNDG